MRILLLTPLMAEYYKSIIKEIEKKGHTVIWYYCGLKKRNDIDELFNRINKNRARKLYEKYINSIVENNKEGFDKVILIFGGSYFNKNSFNILKKAYSNAEFVYYNWDSVINYPNIKDFYQLFDRYYSFDKKDCEKYGFEFLPLFYCNNYLKLETQYDYLYIMTYSKKKYQNYLKVKNSIPIELNGLEYLVFPNKLKYYISKFFRMKYVMSIDKKSIHFKPLNRDEAYKLIALSRVIIDTPLAGQNGLTIRTFEALHQKRKLITTNENIISYDFYSKENISLIRNGDKVPTSFFKDNFNDKYKLSEKYSINNFTKIILG